MSKFLEKGMCLVYLDQCAISRFLPNAGNESWRDLRDVVLKGNTTRKMVCPSSLEHLIETSMLPDGKAIFLDELMRKLSFGWTLADEAMLIARQIIAKLRSRLISRAKFLEKRLLRPITYPGTLAKLREVKALLDANNAWVMQGVNELNAFTRNGRNADTDLLRYFIKRRTGERVKKLLTEVLDSLKTGRAVVRVEEGNDKVLNWASKVVYELIVTYRLAIDEGRQLCQLLRAEGLNFIPTLKIKSELEAMQFLRREKIEPRDQYDITRAACALPYADIFITDGGKAGAIRELKLDATYKTEVFSMRASELNRLVARLNEVVG